jgi:hypothetical protein
MTKNRKDLTPGQPPFDHEAASPIQPNFDLRDAAQNVPGQGRQGLPDDAGDLRLNAALARQPHVTIPTDFAARVAAQALHQAAQSAQASAIPSRPPREPYRWPLGWGLTATLCSLAILLVLMFHYAQLTRGLVPSTIELTLALEFVLLFLGLSYYFSAFHPTLRHDRP